MSIFEFWSFRPKYRMRERKNEGRERERGFACHIQVEALAAKQKNWRIFNLVPSLSALFLPSDMWTNYWRF